MVSNTALVTGASTGIGATYARLLAGRGMDLVLVARDGLRMQALAGELIEQHGVSVEILVADLTDPADVAEVERRLRRDGGAISMFVNNAGMSGGGEISYADPDLLERIIALNVLAFARLGAAAASRFREAGRGTIINIASVTALFADRQIGIYPATKAFVIAFGQALTNELASEPVRVQTVLPGATRTEIWERAGKNIDDLPAEMVMEVEDLVAAALTGLDLGERVPIPSLPDPKVWELAEIARTALYPFLSLRDPAPRYRVDAHAVPA